MRVAAQSRTGGCQRRGGIKLALVLMAACVAVGGRSVTADAAPAPNQCISPDFGGLDLNVFYDVTEQIVVRGCPEINAGQHFRVWAGWWGNYTFDAAPPGFVPAGATPLEDFVAKFVAVKYVVDSGTDEEKTYLFPNGDNLWTGILFDLPHANTLTLGTLKPLPVGPHRIDI